MKERPQKMSLKRTLVILSVLSLSACKSIEVPNITVCADLSKSQGYCVEAITGSDYTLDGSQWESFNKTALKLSPQDYGLIKATLLKLCKKQKDCDFQSTEETFNKIESQLNF